MKRETFAVVISLLLLSACERIPYHEYALPEYDGELSWTQEVKKTDWPERYDHAAVVFDNHLWIFGGYNSGLLSQDSYLEDIWKSADGINWELVLDDAPWKGRRGHKVVAFNDGNGEALYLIGGFKVDEATGERSYNNDVWKSTNGVNWENIKPQTSPELKDSADWMPRMHHACVVANHNNTNYIYLIGGRTLLENQPAKYASVYFNDVWRSTDGVSWEKLPNNDYGIRSEHAATVNPETGRIYIQGGVHGVIFEPAGNGAHPVDNWESLWYSDNGIDWYPEMNTEIVASHYLFRSGHQVVFYKGKLWGLPGKTTSSVHYQFAESSYYTSWTYISDNIWNIDSKGTDIDSRHSYPAVFFNNKVYILGGFTGSNAQSNDVWSAQ